MRKIIVRLTGQPYGKANPLVGTNLLVEGRVYDTETEQYESDWAVLPVRKIEFEATASSFAEARLTTFIGEMENVEMALQHVKYESIIREVDRTRGTDGTLSQAQRFAKFMYEQIKACGDGSHGWVENTDDPTRVGVDTELDLVKMAKEILNWKDIKA